MATYTKTNWINGQAPAISADNLNKIEQGIKDCADDTLTTEETADFNDRLGIS